MPFTWKLSWNATSSHSYLQLSVAGCNTFKVRLLGTIIWFHIPTVANLPSIALPNLPIASAFRFLLRTLVKETPKCLACLCVNTRVGYTMVSYAMLCLWRSPFQSRYCAPVLQRCAFSQGLPFGAASESFSSAFDNDATSAQHHSLMRCDLRWHRILELSELQLMDKKTINAPTFPWFRVINKWDAAVFKTRKCLRIWNIRSPRV